MQNQIKCLDHGFVKLLNLSGPVNRIPDSSIDLLTDQITMEGFQANDIDPALTARISFNNFDKERSRELDLKLVEYLIKNKHNTPIEMIEIWLEMKLPIFLARQFVRHRTATINEVSARYSILPEEWYIPEIVGGKPTNGMKQGQEDNLSSLIKEHFQKELANVCKENYDAYTYYIEQGVAPEHARLFLHVNNYTHWLWKQDLHNLMHFLSLRLDSHAQIEARIYANAIYTLLSIYLPESMKLFDKYRRF